MQTRALIRIAFVLLLSSVSLAVTLPDIAVPWHPFATFGYSANPASGLITAVDADAARRGLRAGERIDLTRLSLGDGRRRYATTSPLAPEGTLVVLPLVSGHAVSLRSHLFSRTLADNVSDVLQMLGFLFIVAVAAVLVLLRPAPATWAFFLFCASLGFVPAQLTKEYMPAPVLLAIGYLRIALTIAAQTALVSFALRFPLASPAGAGRFLERILIFGVAPALTALATATYFGLVHWEVQLVGTIYIWGTQLVAALILISRYLNARPEERSRLEWIVAAFAVAFIPSDVIAWIEGAGYFPPIWIINLTFLFVVIAPIAVAYTVFKHRLFDIRLILSRAVLYAILTSIMVGLLALVDWGFGRWLAESRFAFAAELVMAVLIGVLLTTAHRRIEQFLNNVIFRAQALALMGLRRFAQETDLITDPARLVLQTYDALASRLESEYVLIYTADGSAFTLATPGTNTAPAILPADDFAVLRLRRWGEAFECDEPRHVFYGALLLPMMARGQLVGFVACGPKTDRTHYIAEEIETLSLLAHRTGNSYAWLTMRPGVYATVSS